MMMHNNSFNKTCVQSWTRNCLWVFSVLLFSLNVLCFFVGLYVCPEMFRSQDIQGHVCKRENHTDCYFGKPHQHQQNIYGMIFPHAPLQDTITYFEFSDIKVCKKKKRIKHSSHIYVAFYWLWENSAEQAQKVMLFTERFEPYNRDTGYK